MSTNGRSLSYWLESLTKRPPALELPCDQPRPLIRNPSYARILNPVSSELAQCLAAHARASSTSPFTVYLAAFSIFLGKVAGTKDFLLGVGLNGDVAPLAIHLDANESFLALVTRLDALVQQGAGHRPVAMSELLGALDLQLDPARAPLFDVSFGEGDPRGDLHVRSSDAGFELTYDTTLFSAPMAERMARTFHQVLRAVAGNGGIEVARVPLLSESDAASLLAEYSLPAFNWPKHLLIHQLFEAKADQTPDAIALAFAGKTMSYAELEARSNTVAQRLIASGVGPDAVVMLVHEPSFEMIVATLAVLKAGGACLPVDPEVPAERVQYVRNDSGARVVLTVSRLKPRLERSAHGCEILCVDEILERPRQEPARRPVGRTEPDGLAYVVYTSGSTRAQQGVLIEHRNVVHVLIALKEDFGVRSSDALILLLSYTFDASIQSIWLALMSGAKLVLVDRKTVLDAGGLTRVLQNERVTHLDATPSVLAGLSATVLPALKRVVVGGETCPVATAREWSQYVRFYNEYGPTEATVGALRHLVNPVERRDNSTARLSTTNLSSPSLSTPRLSSTNLSSPNISSPSLSSPSLGRVSSSRVSTASLVDLDEAGAFEMTDRVPIGRPIGMTRVYVLDWGGCPVPIGVRGELYLGGPGLARGYLHNENLTRERFIPDPHTADAENMYRTSEFVPGRPSLADVDSTEQRMYRTGDIVAWLPDGSIEFFGSAESQVTIRGFRIELGEVEAALLAHPSVIEVAASVRNDAGTQRLYGHLAASRSLAPEELQAFLAETLPVHMIPDVFVQLPALPRGVAGKIERRALPAPSFEVGVVDPPANRIELELRALWAEIFGIAPNKISVTQSFFELGGDSKLQTDLVARVQKKLGIVLRFTNLATAPTIRSIAAEIAAAAPDQGALGPRTDAALAMPATSVQRRMYVIQQGNPRSTSYNIPQLWEIHGESAELSEPRIADACRTLVERHESLRTAFFFQEGQILAKVATNPRVELERYELGEGGVEAASAAFVRPFRLENPPLFRAAVFVEGARLRFIAVDVHHIVTDLTSVQVIMDELVDLLQGRTLPDLELRYFDYAAWLTSDAGRERLAQSRAHWATLLHDEPPVLDLPQDFRRPLSRQQTADELEIFLPRDVSDDIVAFARQNESTPFAFFSSAYSIFLSCMTGSPDVVFGYPTAGRRPHPGFERVIGMFVNTLVFRARIERDQSFAQLLRSSMKLIRESLRNGEYPFEDLVEDLRLSPAPGRNPIFDTMIAYEKWALDEYTVGTSTLRERYIREQVVPMDLLLVVRDTPSGYALRFEYSADLFKRASIERFAESLTSIISHVLRDGNVGLGELHTLSAQERERLLYGFNDTEHALPPVRAVHELFEQQVRERPNAPAVVMNDVSWSYAEVDAKANALANLLREHGVGRDTIVGILLEPCPEMLVSLLGVLKAGGAFMPIDPDYPAARQQYMIKDSQARVLVTSTNRADGLREVYSGPILDIADLGAARELRSQGNSEPGDLAYVIYTSGSTGQPKGVLVEHGNLLNFSSWQVGYFTMTPDDIVAKYAAFGFDASICEMVPAMISGACLAIVPGSIRLSLDELDDYLARCRATIAFFPTAFGEMFLKQATKHVLRAAILGGEKLRNIPLDRCTILNIYGPTECTVCATTFELDRPYDNIPIGKPLWNTSIFILDKLGRVCPVGVPGEIHISGKNVARGYLNQPHLTSEKFVADPYVPGRRMYRTGDLARWLEDGNIEFVGRIDTQVKVRGFRIELGEIEQALMTLPGIREATVIARANPDVSGDVTLVAFVTGPSGEAEDAWKTALRQTLPTYMVPNRIVRLDEIPLTANGKVDKRRLPAIELDVAAVVAPRNETESDVRRIYADVLGLPEASISVDASFLDLGGHSLKAAGLLSVIYREKGLQLRFAQFLQASSVADVARQVEADAPESRRTEAAWERAPEGTPLPLTSSQGRIFAVHQLATWSTTYNIPSAWTLDPKVDLDRLERALGELVSRHHALRASFSTVDGMPMQHFASEARLAVERRDVDDANLGVTLESFVSPFDLSRAPLMRALLLRTETQNVLAIDIHHIVADGLSIRLLIEDLEALYHGRATAAPAPTFADYVWWERSAAGQSLREEQKAWWLGRFADRPEPLELPYDFSRPPRFSFEGDEVAMALPAETSAPLLERAKARALTPLGVFLGAWALVLSRLGNTPDVVIGVPASGRHSFEMEKLVGMFVNTVPVRLQLQADEEFFDFCVRVGTEALEAFERQSYQLNDLVADLAVRRDPARNPIFDVVFAWDDEGIVDVTASSLVREEIPATALTAKFDLSIRVQNTKKGQKVSLQFAKKLFKRATAERFLAHLRSILEQAAREPQAKIRDFRMLPAWEREMLLEELNRTAKPFPTDKTLVDFFLTHVRERPNAIAVADREEEWSYQEVDRRASILAARLASTGVRTGDVVALSMPRSRHMMIGILGIMKAGAGYLPIDPEAPRERVALMVADSNARFLVAESETFGLEPELVIRWDSIDWTASVAFESRAEPTSIAYVIYTSGSTGRPKGVVLEHRGLVNVLLSTKEAFGLTHEDRCLLFSSYTFDYSVDQYGVGLISGGRVVIATKETLLDHDALERFVVAMGVTYFATVPLFLFGWHPKGPLPIKSISVGGDILPVAVAERWSRGRTLYNIYGPTETTIHSIRHRVTSDDYGRQRLPIGRPIANTRIYIGDWTKNLAPLGVPGEVYIGGAGVARGYLNNPELTAERFGANPFVEGDRLYKTGDIARWTPEGTIDFLGRIDHQVKIRGFRIELGEIEATLLKHPAVVESAVTALAYGEDKRLCAYVVIREGRDHSDIRNFVARSLPSYMVPDAVVVLPELPLTVSGKVDRKRLPEPVFEAMGDEDVPQSDAEEKLVQIWAALLKLEPAHTPLTRSFFELGGHSLLLMPLIIRMHEAFGVRLNPVDVFEHTTIRDLASLVGSRKQEGIVPIPRVAARAHYPMSSVQRRLFAIQQANPESIFYNVPTVFSVEGRVTRERLEEVVRALFQRHAAFRTEFAIESGEPVQRVVPSVPFSLQVIESDEHVNDLAARLMQRFDLAVAPLARMWLVQRTNGDELLVIDMHHIIVDGYSNSILWREVADIIRAAPLAPLRINYTDFAVWQQTPEHRQRLLEQRQFWMDQYATLPPLLELPCDFRRPAVRNNEGDVVVVRLSKEEHSALSRVASSQDATLFVTLLSCYFVFLSRISGSDDMVVGVPSSGRVHPDIQNLVGMFVNTIPWRARVPHQGTFVDFLSEVKKTSIDFLSREEYQLEDLINDLGAHAPAGRNPLFDVMFAFATRDTGVIDAGNVKLHVLNFAHRTAKMDLTLTATELGAGVEFMFEYPTELFERATVERLARHFATLVRSVLRDPAQPLASLDILTADEKKQLLVDFNATEHALPEFATAHQMFESWVDRTPNATAVIFGELRWSYAELNHRANAVASWLLGLGIGKGDIVAIVLDACAEQAAAILGVLKSGAAFLPIDADLPPARKSYMLADSQARALLTRNNLAEDIEFSGERLKLERLSACSDAARPPVVPPAAEDAAYVIYTSGSSGKPKGVVIEHRSLQNLSHWYVDYFEMAATDGISRYAGFSFDASISELFPTFVAGATLVVVPAELRLSPKGLSAYFENNNVRVAFLPTQFGEHFIRMTDNRSLRVLTLGGEKLRSYRPTPWRIVNAYGPTEYTVYTAAFEVTRPYENIPIGKPVWNTQILVLDKHDRLCPIGVTGELCVAGKNMARGYLHRPELTSEKFVSHPFQPGERMYRTGDNARWLPDGNLEYLGRSDTQIKVRGFRIELGEIEQALLAIEGIKDVVVIGATDEVGTTYLVAYVVSATMMDEPLVRDELEKSLPSYMVPAHFCQLDALPVNANGKVDRKALPAVEQSGSQEIVAATTGAEHKLVSIWSNVLGVGAEKIGVTANFFDLGGHSLRAIALAGEVYREFQMDLRVSDIFRHPTIRAMAKRITGGEKELSLGVIARRSPAESYPASSVQKRMFLLQQMDRESIAYNVPTLFSVSPTVGKENVALALAHLANRHDAFRCSFFLDGAEVRVRVAPSATLHFDERKTTEALRDEMLLALVKPFDLSAPAVRVAWIETERSSYLFFDMHHIVTDGASLGILLQELTTLLRGGALGELTCDLIDCALWERNEAAVSRLSEQQEYWHRAFVEGVPALDLLTDYPRPSVLTSEGEALEVDLSPQILRELRVLAQEHGFSLYSLLLAAFNVLLSRLTRQEEIAVGTPVSGRWHPDMHGVLGMFVNTLVFSNRPFAQRSFIEFALEVSERTIEGLDHQAFPFADLVELVCNGRRAGHDPLYDVFFALQSTDSRRDGSEELLSPCSMPHRIAKSDLSLIADESPDGLRLVMEYRTCLFRRSTVERFLRCFTTLLENIVVNPKSPLHALSILTADDRQLVQIDFNRTEVDFPCEDAVHHMFERMAARFPDHRVLVHGNESYTYAEADALANALAQRLTNLGVQRESIVAILTPPSRELILAELAVLKAGAAFLPLDHRYPRERLEYMLRDSGALVLLTVRGLDADLDWPGARLVLGRNLFDGPVSGPPTLNVKPSDLAYVIYTSGSTGRPKGVCIEHGSLLNTIHYAITEYGLSETDRLSKYMGVGFDASIIETFPALCSGAELHIVPEEIRLSPPGLARWIQQSGVTGAVLPTPIGEEFIRVFERDDASSSETTLRRLVLGGDRLRRVSKTPFRVINEYGPTEFTVSATNFTVDAHYDNIPIGKPNANVKVFILDAFGQLCPPSVPGEICLAGKGVARGYLGNPEMTAKKFVSSLLASGDRLYHTGDLGRWLDDGNIEFLGRIDGQVKIRGYRIELGEIEQAILEVPGVRGCVVVDREDAAGDKILCGYYVASEDVTDGVICEAIGRKLPDYMIPSAIIQLQELPFTTSGKVDKRRLPEPEVQPRERVVVPPGNAAEALLVAAFAQSLGSSDLGIDDDFFAFGGNSMKAVAVVAALASDFRITANDLFRLRTARALARELPMQRGDLQRRLTARIESTRNGDEGVPFDGPELEADLSRYRERSRLYETVALGSEESYRNILLTGATGFLGCYLLRDLLLNTDAKIHLTVRAKHLQEAWDRITSRGAHYFGPGTFEAFQRRIILLLSDLSQPMLGLDRGTFEARGRTIDCVLHCAALTKHYGDPSTFYAANVEATKNVIALARRASAHFSMVSTTSVGAGEIPNRTHALFTEFDCDIGQVTPHHYVRTKLEAEKAVIELRQHGLVSNIFRVGFLAPDSQSHKFQENADDSGFVQRLRSYSALGRIRSGALNQSFCPVDEVSKAILSLLPLSSLSNETHHIDRSIEPREVERISRANAQCELMDDASFYQWLADHLGEAGVAQAATSVLLHEGLLDEGSKTHVVTVNEKTERLLARVGFSWGNISPAQVWSLVKG
ncbi:amino acid adenylation domain-containing protein [Pendulispora rubella]|uniref:Amino acid adenylation domain-containing protein n=1 Tax=Pendulispora rubella TaxID=2741070 RepID=A0ABZ2L2Y5_9BACT